MYLLPTHIDYNMTMPKFQFLEISNENAYCPSAYLGESSKYSRVHIGIVANI